MTALSAALLLAGGTTAIAIASGSEEPPPPPWVNADGSVNPEALPTTAPQALPDGRPNPYGMPVPDSGAFTGSNPAGTVESDAPVQEGQPDTQNLSVEIPEPVCTSVTKQYARASLALQECKNEGLIAQAGVLTGGAPDQACAELTATVGTVSKKYNICGGRKNFVDTGSLEGTSVVWSYREYQG
ncbi:hypothetical protein [Streptomyces lavendofoliae]|uniref:hypothetical protein n=1 Tax=Streptomyces lavendofoliae TaxID=67314 RepID=UPI003D8D5EAF